MMVCLHEYTISLYFSLIFLVYFSIVLALYPLISGIISISMQERIIFLLR